jgi:hypothetical protein
MEDVLDLYEEPYDPHYPTVCLDEKPVVLHADVHPPVPVEPGRPQRVDYEYERKGTRNLFVMVEPLAGWRHVEVTAQRTMQDYAKVVRWLVEEVYPHAAFCDDWSFITRPSMAGGANMAEIEIAIPERNALSRRLQDEAALRRQVVAVETERNEQRRGIGLPVHVARCALPA